MVAYFSTDSIQLSLLFRREATTREPVKGSPTEPLSVAGRALEVYACSVLGVALGLLSSAFEKYQKGSTPPLKAYTDCSTQCYLVTA